MLNSQESALARSKTLYVPKQPFAGAAPTSDAVALENKIRERAHQLYLCRGCESGGAIHDWVQAEGEILNQQR
jgi:hypothetical protein